MKDKLGEIMVKPCFETCQCCPDWDDINGCWQDKQDACVNSNGEFSGISLNDDEENEVDNDYDEFDDDQSDEAVLKRVNIHALK